MSKLGKMRGLNQLSAEISFDDSASTTAQFDETYAPVIFAGAAYVKGLYITEWTGAEVNGGINIQDGTSTTESSNTDVIIADLSTGIIGTPANCSMNLQKAFTWSGGVQIANGLHISTTADLGVSNVLKVRVLFEPVGGAGGAALVNLAKSSQPDILISPEKAYADDAASSVEFDEAYSNVISSVPTLLHSITITEWSGAEMDGGLRVQDGTSTVIANNTDLINLDLSTGDIGTPANDSMNITKSWDFPGGIYCGSGLAIGTTADLGSDDVIKIQVSYEII